MVKEDSKGKAVNTSTELFNILKPLFAEADDVESLFALFLDTKNRIISMEKMFSGTLTASAVYPREIIKSALAAKSAAVIVSHNHPSGDPVPSQDDISITFQVCLALSSVGITLHEHLIVGDHYFSMADTGYIQKARSRCRSFLKGGDNEETDPNQFP